MSSLEDLILLAMADAFGCGVNRHFGAWPYLKERLEDYREIMRRPMIGGQDLIAAGYRPGTQFREMIDRAKQLHFSGLDRERVLQQLRAEYPLHTEKTTEN